MENGACVERRIMTLYAQGDNENIVFHIGKRAKRAMYARIKSNEKSKLLTSSTAVLMCSDSFAHLYELISHGRQWFTAISTCPHSTICYPRLVLCYAKSSESGCKANERKSRDCRRAVILLAYFASDIACSNDVGRA